MKPCDPHRWLLIFQFVLLISFLEVVKAKESSLRELSKACKKHDLAACNKLSDIQVRQAQKEVSIRSSVENIIKCNKKDAEACYNQGFDEDALGNLSVANKFYEKACELKWAAGCANRGYRANIAKQAKVAKKFYLQACDLGHIKSCNVFGAMEITNDDLYEAYQYFTKSCNGGFPYGCYNMGWVQAQWQNFKLADQYYQQACKAKVKEACENAVDIAERVNEVNQSDPGPERKYSKDIPCEKIGNVEFLPLATSAISTYGDETAYAINATITKVNYEIFNRKKECGIKNIRLPASLRLPYTGLEVKDRK